jgi:hypothetical protein
MIVERHGGQLSLLKAQPDGCVFRILLPASASAGASSSSEWARDRQPSRFDRGLDDTDG